MSGLTKTTLSQSSQDAEGSDEVEAGGVSGTLTIKGGSHSAYNLRIRHQFDISVQPGIDSANDGEAAFNDLGELCYQVNDNQTASEIQAAYRNLNASGAATPSNVDVNQFVVTHDEGNDKDIAKNDLASEVASILLSGGQEENQGEYSFTVDKAFVNGEQLTIKDEMDTEVLVIDFSDGSVNTGDVAIDVNTNDTTDSQATEILNHIVAELDYSNNGSSGSEVSIIEDSPADGTDLNTLEVSFQ